MNFTHLRAWGFALLLGMGAAGGSRDLRAADDPGDYESYEVRPDILEQRPVAHPELGDEWEKFKRGQLEATALLLESYPNEDIDFLARDAEYLYDLARLATRSDLSLQKRLHLLNITRMTRGDQNLREYLAQEGISPETLASGKRILIVDTSGFGRTSKAIRKQLPPELAENVRTHLLASIEAANPSMRVFLTALDPAAPQRLPISYDTRMKQLEVSLPHFTDWSTRIERIGDRWHALSHRGTQSDGIVSREKARERMEDLRHYLEQPAVQELLKERREEWRRIMATRSDRDKLVAELQKILSAHPGDPFREAMVRDFIEMQETTLARPPYAKLVELAEVGLKAIEVKTIVIRDFADWCKIQFGGL